MKEVRPSLVPVSSTFHALCSIPIDVYLDSEHAQTPRSKSKSSPALALAVEDKEDVLSSHSRSAENSEIYSKYLEHSAILPAFKLITAPPCCLDTRTMIIYPSTTFSTVSLTPADQTHVLSLIARSIVHYHGYATSLALSEIVLAYKLNPEPSFRSDMPKLSIQSSTSFSASIPFFPKIFRNT